MQVNEVEKEMQRFRATLRGHTLSLGDTDTHRKCHHHQYCQLDKFSDEITALKRGTSVEKSSHIYRLDPVLERGLLGVGGRLSKATMPDMALNTQSFLRKISTSPFSFYTAFMSFPEEITNFPVFVNTNWDFNLIFHHVDCFRPISGVKVLPGSFNCLNNDSPIAEGDIESGQVLIINFWRCRNVENVSCYMRSFCYCNYPVLCFCETLVYSPALNEKQQDGVCVDVETIPLLFKQPTQMDLLPPWFLSFVSVFL